MATLGKHLFDSLQGDLRTLSAESKLKKASGSEVRDSAERALLRVLQARNESAQSAGAISHGDALSRGGDVLEPFLLACDTRNAKLAQLAAEGIYKLVRHDCVRSLEQVDRVLARLNVLVEQSLEEVKTLQILMSMLTVSKDLLVDTQLASAFVLSFHLYFSKDSLVQNTAAATIRQMVSEVFERVVDEDTFTNGSSSSTATQLSRQNSTTANDEDATDAAFTPRLRHRKAPSSLLPSASNAYLLFQDLCHLTNADPPSYLVGLNEMSRLFGLELIESVLSEFPNMFLQHPEFSFLLKERVCPLVIRLFSPGTHGPTTSSATSAGAASSSTAGGSGAAGTTSSVATPASAMAGGGVLGIVSASSSSSFSSTSRNTSGLGTGESGGALTGSSSALNAAEERSAFGVAVRLLRIVSILVQRFYSLLVTESEIFLSMLVRFLEGDRVMWRRTLAAEVIQRLFAQPELLRSVCMYYDMREHSAKIFQGMVNALSDFMQSLQRRAATASTSSGSASGGGSAGTGINNNNSGGGGGGGSSSGGGGNGGSGSGIGIGNSGPSGTGVGGSNLTGGSSSGGAALGASSSLVGSGGNLGGMLPGPLIVNNKRHMLIEMLDKHDSPFISDHYGFSVAFACLLELVNTVSSLVMYRPSDPSSVPGTPASGSTAALPSTQSTASPSASTTTVAFSLSSSTLLPMHPVVRDVKRHTDEIAENEDLSIWREMVASLWHGVLAAFAPLLDSGKLDESGLQAVLKSFQTLTNLCGVLNLGTQRDAFVTVLCQRSLPPRYDPSARMTTANVQCVRALLNVAHCLGAVLGPSAWYLVLETLMEVDAVLGLNTAGASAAMSLSMGASISSSGVTQVAAAPVVSASVKSSLPQHELSLLSSTLARLFESSEYLSDAALNHMLNALCRLSQPSSSTSGAADKKKLSSGEMVFALTRIAEIGVVNATRVGCFWTPVRDHLLSICSDTAAMPVVRECAVDALAAIGQAALTASVSLATNSSLQLMCLEPLQALCTASQQVDVRARQMEALVAILRTHGDAVHAHAWPILCEIASSAVQTEREAGNSDNDDTTISMVSTTWGARVVRPAFVACELVVKDYLQVVPLVQVQSVVALCGRFLRQRYDMNISLTASELLWNVSDYVATRKDAAPMADMWMSLFEELSNGCVHERPEVRKSANQTLMATVTSHASALTEETLDECVWRIFFPLLERVRQASLAADNTDAKASGKSHNVGNRANIIVHHTRDTESKQWDEMRVLSLQGIAQIFYGLQGRLSASKRFNEAWRTLLDVIQSLALSDSQEVALAAVNVLRDLVRTEPNTAATTGSSSVAATKWRDTLQAWAAVNAAASISRTSPPFLPQPFFHALAMTLIPVKRALGVEFSASDVHACASLLVQLMAYPSSEAFVDQDHPSKLQQLILDALVELPSGVGKADGTHGKAVHSVIVALLECAAVLEHKQVEQQSEQHARFPLRYAPMASEAVERATELLVTLVKGGGDAAVRECVRLGTAMVVLRALSRGLRQVRVTVPASHAEKCGLLMMERLFESGVILQVVKASAARVDAYGKGNSDGAEKTTARVAEADEDAGDVATVMRHVFSAVYDDIEEFLYEVSATQDAGEAKKKRGEDEAVEGVVRALEIRLADCIVSGIVPAVQAICDEDAGETERIVQQLMSLLDRGAAAISAGEQAGVMVRQDFAKACFEALLRFSVREEERQSGGEGGARGEGNNVSSTDALMERCRVVIGAFLADASESGAGPTTRPTVEVVLVLKAMSGLVGSLVLASKDSDADRKRNRRIVLQMYPQLVDCVTCRDEGVRAMVQAILRGIGELL